MSEIINFFEQIQQPCIFKKIFGYECPGCGLQTAFILLLKGHIVESLVTYPPLPFLLFLFLFFIIHLIFKIKKGELILQWAFRFSMFAIITNYIWKIL